MMEGADNMAAQLQNQHVPKLNSNFVVNQWTSKGTCPGNLDVARCFEVICQKLSKIPPENWHSLLKNDFNFVNWEETNELYWGPDFRSNPDFLDFCAFRFNSFKFGDNPTTVYNRTQEFLGRFFTHKSFTNVTAALLVKLNEAKGGDSTCVLGESVSQRARQVLKGPNENIWSQRLTLSAELKKLYPNALSEGNHKDVCLTMSELKEVITLAATQKR